MFLMVALRGSAIFLGRDEKTSKLFKSMMHGVTVLFGLYTTSLSLTSRLAASIVIMIVRRSPEYLALVYANLPTQAASNMNVFESHLNLKYT